MYVIRSVPGTQVRDFFVESPNEDYANLKWSDIISEAFLFPTKEIAETHCVIANKWCRCEVVWFEDQKGLNESPNEAYDRAMGVI